jgi:hypothetical protein
MAQKTGKQHNLGSEKTKKQSIICGALAWQKNETRRKQAHQADMLWSDEDFEYCKLDEYCQGAITEEDTVEPKRVFHAYLTDWAVVQFNSKGDDVYAQGCRQSIRGWDFMTKIMIVLGSFVRLIVMC